MACASSSSFIKVPTLPVSRGRQRMRGPIWLELIILILLSFGVARAAHAGSFEPKPISDEAYGETFTATSDLSDGTFVLVQYVFTNAGFGDGKAACRALIVRPGSKGINSAIRVDRDEWSYTAAGNRLTVDKCELSSRGGKTRFKVQTDKVQVDLTLSAAPRSTRPPNHRLKVSGDEFYESDILIPWAAATVSLKTPSGRASLKGMGYLDHTRSNTRLPKIASRWLRFRGLSGATPTLFEVHYSPSGRPKGWMWSKGDPRPTKIDVNGLKLKATRSAVTLNISESALQTTKVIYRYRPAKEWGMLGRLAKPWVGDPETRTFRATLTRPDGTTVSGILEQAQISN